MAIMIQSDYFAQFVFLTCAVWSLIRLCSWEKVSYPFFAVFVVSGIPSSAIWLLSLWSVWTYAFPVLMLILGVGGWRSWQEDESRTSQRESAICRICSACLRAWH